MGDITIIELNMEGAEFTSYLPFSGRKHSTSVDSGEETADEAGEESDGSTASAPGSKKKGAAVFGLVFLVLLGIALRKKRSGDEQDLD
jgi:hypothetical protein